MSDGNTSSEPRRIATPDSLPELASSNSSSPRSGHSENESLNSESLTVSVPDDPETWAEHHQATIVLIVFILVVGLVIGLGTVLLELGSAVANNAAQTQQNRRVGKQNHAIAKSELKILQFLKGSQKNGNKTLTGVDGVLNFLITTELQICHSVSMSCPAPPSIPKPQGANK